MIQPSIERTATAPVAVRVSLVAGGPAPLVGDLGDCGSTSISEEAMAADTNCEICVLDKAWIVGRWILQFLDGSMTLRDRGR